MRHQARRLIVAGVIGLSVWFGWRIGATPAMAGTYTHTLHLATMESALITCASDALRVDRVQDQSLSVTIICYQDQSDTRQPAGDLRIASTR
jgi:hypothetical protein